MKGYSFSALQMLTLLIFLYAAGKFDAFWWQIRNPELCDGFIKMIEEAEKDEDANS